MIHQRDYVPDAPSPATDMLNECSRSKRSDVVRIHRICVTICVFCVDVSSSQAIDNQKVAPHNKGTSR
jgi:hypothetical protein